MRQQLASQVQPSAHILQRQQQQQVCPPDVVGGALVQVGHEALELPPELHAHAVELEGALAPPVGAQLAPRWGGGGSLWRRLLK